MTGRHTAAEHHNALALEGSRQHLGRVGPHERLALLQGRLRGQQQRRCQRLLLPPAPRRQRRLLRRGGAALVQQAAGNFAQLGLRRDTAVLLGADMLLVVGTRVQA